jgi:hypothetical protein
MLFKKRIQTKAVSMFIFLIFLFSFPLVNAEECCDWSVCHNCPSRIEGGVCYYGTCTGPVGSRTCVTGGRDMPSCGTNSCGQDMGACCTPDCSGKNCGSDGCGGSCGSCGSGSSCVSGSCCDSDNLCGGTCYSYEVFSCGGSCWAGDGSDGTGNECCGGSAVYLSSGDSCCGSTKCSSSQVCISGSCCTPSCSGKECGSDGCGGSCGSCGSGKECSSGSCVCSGSEPSCSTYSSGSTCYYSGSTSCGSSGWTSCSYSTDSKPSCSTYSSGSTCYYSGSTSCGSSGWTSCSYSTDSKPSCSTYSSGSTCYYSGSTSCGSSGWTSCSYSTDSKPSCSNYVVGNTCYYSGSTSCGSSGWTSCSYSSDSSKPSCSAYSSGSTCYYSGSAVCGSSGWSCSYSSSDSSYASCNELGYVDSSTCYYGSQTNFCTINSGWTCSDSSSCSLTCGGVGNECCSGDIYYDDVSCHSTSGCQVTTNNRDDSEYYCESSSSGCGVAYWSVGGEVDPTSCCGDDSGEFYLIVNSGSDASNYFTETSDGCCSSSTDCISQGVCYNSGTVNSANIPNKAYCINNVWYGGDYSSTACNAILGSGYWSQGGEVNPTTCCGDDLNEYKDFGIEGINIDWNDNSAACCTTQFDCVRNGVCTDSGSSSLNLNPGFDDNYAYCVADSSRGVWQDCDDSASVCGGCGLNWIYSGETILFGEYSSTLYESNCCGDDANEYAKLCINATSNDQIGCNPGSSFQTVCCDESTDCVDKNGICRDSNSFVAYGEDVFGGYYCYNGKWINPDSGICGDGICSNGEDCSSCSSDCGTCSAICNDGICSSGELCICSSGNDCNNYPDCILTDTCSNKGTCGDGICSYYETFTQYYCELDCLEDSTIGDDGKSYNVGGEIANGWCGNDNNEFFRYCDGTHDSKVSCLLSCSATDNNFDACCDNLNDCIDQNGNCQTSGRCYEHFGYSYCENGKWHDPDESEAYCLLGSTGGVACQIDSNLVLDVDEDYDDLDSSSLNNAHWLVSDTDDNGVGSCCGDDYNENFLSSKGKHNDSSWACCDNPTDCVWGSECFEIGERNNDNTLICGVNREWDNAEEWYVEQTHDDFPVLIRDEVELNSIHTQRYVSCNSPLINRNQEWKLPNECKGDVIVKFIDKFDNSISGVYMELHAYDDYFRYDTDFSYKTLSDYDGFARFDDIDASYYYAIVPPVEDYSLVPFVLEVGPKTRVNYSSESNWGTIRLTDSVKCTPDCINIEYGVCSADCEGVNGCRFNDRENPETFELIPGEKIKTACDGYSKGVSVGIMGTNSNVICCGSEFDNKLEESSAKTKSEEVETTVECEGGNVILLRKLINYRGRPVNMVVAVCR